VLHGLRARIAAPVPTPVPRVVWLGASAVIVGAGLAAAMWQSAPQAPVPPQTPVAAVPLRVAAPAPVVTPDVPEAAVTAPLEASTAVAPPPSAVPARRAPDRLAEEVTILRQAAKDLRAGRAAESLRALGEHQRRFPSGLLALERRAARAEALCSLGRFAEAEVELSTLGRVSPGSPLTVRAQQRCAGPTTKPR
jgi:hypothetical protein